MKAVARLDVPGVERRAERRGAITNGVDVHRSLLVAMAPSAADGRARGDVRGWALRCSSARTREMDNAPVTTTHERRPLPVLEGSRIVLRPGEPGDEAAIAAMFATEDVARWWPTPEPDEIASLVHNRDPDVDVWMIEEGGRVVGLIQAYEESDPMYRHAGIDIVIHPDAHGRGLGPEAIRALARHLFDDRGHHRLVIDPNAANARAIHVYEKVGFRRVGVLRQYEWHAREGGWTDGLLMDLLRDELTQG